MDKNFWQTAGVCSKISLVLAGVGLAACSPKPAPQRPAVTLPIYTAGDAQAGRQAYDDNCGRCHTLKPGSNEKGPELSRVYGAAAASLSDYPFTQALKNSHLSWTADNLDAYIANPQQKVAGTRMRSKPVTDAKTRRDIIAYLSTLR